MSHSAIPSTPFDSYRSGCRARVRTGRPGAAGVIWSEPFEDTLFLQQDSQGRTCVLTLQNHDWAEYDPREGLEADGILLTEDYYLQVLEVVS